MTPVVAFVLGVSAGLAVALCIVCTRVGNRSADPQPAPGQQTQPVLPPLTPLPSCGHAGCALAAELHAIRQLPEVGSR
jgi:hypothetical protein